MSCECQALRDAMELGKIKQTLKINCQPGGTLAKLGIKYNESYNCLMNLVVILETLVDKKAVSDE